MTSDKLEIADTTTARPVFSIVAPVFNEEKTLPHFYRRVVEVIEGMGDSFELVLINDGSQDGSFRTMQELHTRDPRVRVIDFSRNFGHQIAISAGLDHARGNAVIIIDSDLQDPPEVIPQLVARWRGGAEALKWIDSWWREEQHTIRRRENRSTGVSMS